jgi:hypothetical protein
VVSTQSTTRYEFRFFFFFFFFGVSALHDRQFGFIGGVEWSRSLDPEPELR